MNLCSITKRRSTPLRPQPSVMNTPCRGHYSESKVKAVTPGDRFIPNRRRTRLDEAHFFVTRSAVRPSRSSVPKEGDDVVSPPAVTFSPTKTFTEARNSNHRKRLAFLVDDEETGTEKVTKLMGGRRVLSFIGSQSKEQPKTSIFSSKSRYNYRPYAFY
jgi:hypothetical protein